MKKIRQIADTDFIFVIMMIGGYIGAVIGIVMGSYVSELVGIKPGGPMILGTIAGIFVGGGLPGLYLPSDESATDLG